MKEIQGHPGEHISKACERLVKDVPAFTVFNGVRIEAQPGDAASDLVARWSAEMERRRLEYLASPEHKRDQEETAKRRAEQKHVRQEALRTIAASGVREKYPWTDDMGEISGFGGGYEAACRDMVYAGLALLQSTPNADDAAIEKALFAACPDCSVAMFGATKAVVRFVREHGWDEYARLKTQAIQKEKTP